eukprot:1220345-Rhodomonas_salina.1
MICTDLPPGSAECHVSTGHGAHREIGPLQPGAETVVRRRCCLCCAILVPPRMLGQYRTWRSAISTVRCASSSRRAPAHARSVPDTCSHPRYQYRPPHSSRVGQYASPPAPPGHGIAYVSMPDITSQSRIPVSDMAQPNRRQRQHRASHSGSVVWQYRTSHSRVVA